MSMNWSLALFNFLGSWIRCLLFGNIIGVLYNVLAWRNTLTTTVDIYFIRNFFFIIMILISITKINLFNWCLTLALIDHRLLLWVMNGPWSQITWISTTSLWWYITSNRVFIILSWSMGCTIWPIFIFKVLISIFFNLSIFNTLIWFRETVFLDIKYLLQAILS